MAETKRALVTGGGRRIGRAIVEALGKAGWAVAVHYRNSASDAEEAVRAIEAAGGRAVGVRANLADEAETGALIAHAQSALGGPLTLLVNSASVFEDDSAREHSRSDWDLHMQTNLRAPVRLSQDFAHALPGQMRGAIINLIDQRVWKLTPQFFTYTLSKSALWTATQTLAQALAPRIRVNAVGPGPTLASIHQSQAQFQAECRATLTGEGSGPDEIVRAVLYLVAATSVTGQMIASDGGQHLNWQTPDTQL